MTIYTKVAVSLVVNGYKNLLFEDVRCEDQKIGKSCFAPYFAPDSGFCSVAFFRTMA